MGDYWFWLISLAFFVYKKKILPLDHNKWISQTRLCSWLYPYTCCLVYRFCSIFHLTVCEKDGGNLIYINLSGLICSMLALIFFFREKNNNTKIFHSSPTFLCVCVCACVHGKGE